MGRAQVAAEQQMPDDCVHRLESGKKKSKVCSGSLCEGKGRHCKNSETTSLGGDGPVVEGAEHVNRLSSRKLAGACESSGEGW